MDLEIEEEKWVKLTRMDATLMPIFFVPPGGSIKEAFQVKTDTFLDSAISHTLQPHEGISGWVLLELPDGVMNQPLFGGGHFRITISEATGVQTISDTIASRHAASNDDVRHAQLLNNGNPTADLSHVPVTKWSTNRNSH